ncbi:MAG: DUF3306 domain-containing protein [Rhodobacteraceae bacterium]|nr:DUF3306 domain-containing protein [Paracoccaceae bacterium]
MTQAQDTFWSRRRKAVASEELAAKLAIEAEAQALEQVAQEKAISEKTDEELLAELELPNPDTLKMGDDFSVFMQKAVPDRLRRRALRTLWRSNPVLANLDGLVDHGEDYTDAAVTFEGMKSAYVVGKGMLKHVEALISQAEEKAATTQDEVAAENLEPAQEKLANPEGMSQEAFIEDEAPALSGDEFEPEDAAQTTEELTSRRHMRFNFDYALESQA